MHHYKIGCASVVLALAASGCASTPMVDGNPVCMQAAEYARMVAVLRDARIPAFELDGYMVKTKITLFPVIPIQRAVFGMSGDPGDAYKSVYNSCIDGLWYNLPATLFAQTGKLSMSYALGSTPVKPYGEPPRPFSLEPLTLKLSHALQPS